ncbi:MAG TPA: T9SS type A sorting domain-containing protein [Bacteroidetes bacterium]|nr:T9SS type A sorting domain-containing protein [Bacteroidota bacterium]
MKNTLLLLIFICTAFNCFSQLNGSYTISTTGGDYPDIGTAVNDLVSQGVSGAVTLEIVAGNYNEQVSLDSIPGVDVNNPLTITASTGDTVNWIFAGTSTDNYLLRINKTPYVTIKDINFFATDPDYSTIIDFMNNSDNLTIMACKFDAGASSSTSETASLIHCNQNTIGNEQNCDSSIISQCEFTGGSYAIYTRAYSLSGRRMFNNKYKNNTFINQNKKAVYLIYNRGGLLDGNIVHADNTITNYYGIDLSHCNETNAINNKIIINSQSIVIGMYTGNSKGASINEKLIYANNYISISANATSKGISTVNGNYVDYLYNTIVMDSSSSSYTFYETNFGGNDIRLLNNILVNNGGGYIYRAQDATNLTQVDHNLYFNNGGVLASLNGVDYHETDSTLANFGFDSLSMIIDPQLDSNGIVHICGTDSIAVYDSLVLVDAEGTIRDIQIPHVGYLEYSLNTHITDLKSSCNSYTWINGNTYSSSNNTATFVLSNANACDSIISLDLTIYPSYNDTFSATICSGDSFILGTQILKATGIYTEQFSSVNGCDSNVVLDLYTSLGGGANLIGPDTVSINDTSTYLISGGDSASWSISGGDILNGNGTDSITVVWDSAGIANISVEVYDSFICFIDTLNMSVNIKDIPTGSYYYSDNRMIIYPNPFSSFTTLELPTSELYILSIYDIAGNKVRTDQVSNKTIIEKGKLTKGIYLIELRSETITLKGKVLVE